MTIKKLWKRICCLFHDDRTRLSEGERIEDWEEVQRERREIEAERHRKEQEILATWFLREEYISAGCFKRFLLRLQFAFRDTRGESHIPQIPKHIRMEIARCLLPDIIAYYESDQGQKEFKEWMTKKEHTERDTVKKTVSLKRKLNFYLLRRAF